MAYEMEKPNRRNRHAWLAFVESLNPDVDPRAIRLPDELRQVAHTLYQLSEASLTATGLSCAKYRTLRE